MRKKIISYLFILQLLALSASGSVSLIMKHQDAAAGSQVTVPVRVKDFINILSVQGTIIFDPAIISFVSVQQFNVPGMNAGNFGVTQIGSGILTFSWFESNLIGQTLADSAIIFSVKFNVTGTTGQLSALTFSSTPTLLEVGNTLGQSETLNLVNGAVHVANTSTVYDLSLIIDKKSGNTGTQVLIPVKGVKFKNINSIQGTIMFDPAVATFTGTTNYMLPGMNSANFGTTLINSGKLTFSWNDPQNLGQNLADSAAIVTLMFDIVGSAGTFTNLDFVSTPTLIEVTDSLSVTLNPDLISGKITVTNIPVTSTFTMDIDSVSVPTLSQVIVPVRVKGFINMYSMQGTIIFDPAIASFVSVEQFGLPGLDIGNFGITQVSAGKLMFSWMDQTLAGQDLADSSIVFAIRFNAAGAPGTFTVLNFSSSPTLLEFSDNSMVGVTPVLLTGKVVVTSPLFDRTISGKTRYAGKANPGTPIPNAPTYIAPLYDINGVIVVLKSLPGLTEIARDTSDNIGFYQFNNLADGNYRLSYDKLTADTMQMVNDVTAIDVALIKYLIGSDTNSDPSKNFSWIYKKAANIDNSSSISAIDVARLKSKIGSPYDPTKNFPRGNWVNIDTNVTVTGSSITANLKVIGYGDFNASSTKYRDSTNNWSLLKASEQNQEIIVRTENILKTDNPDYFEVPLRISRNIADFSSLGLELKYPNNYYKLVYAGMPGNSEKYQNKSGDEDIIADNDDLLVTDHDGIIRVVFATTANFDIIENDEIIKLGFISINKNPINETELTLSGTGEVGNKNGEKIEDAYLLMPKVIIGSLSENNSEFAFSGYPNPFKDKTAISYKLPEDGFVNLSVFNILGENIAEISNEFQFAGNHKVDFSNNTLASGIYTFKLEFTGQKKSEIITIKMIK
jgi:hypothetical protein